VSYLTRALILPLLTGISGFTARVEHVGICGNQKVIRFFSEHFGLAIPVTTRSMPHNHLKSGFHSIDPLNININYINN